MTSVKPSSEIAQRYVDRLAAQGFGDMDDASHETCMLARWSALMNWLDDQHEAALVERKLAAGDSPKLPKFFTLPLRVGTPEDSEPDASGSVDQSVTPVGPVTSGIVPGIQGSTGGGVEVEGAEVTRG